MKNDAEPITNELRIDNQDKFNISVSADDKNYHETFSDVAVSSTRKEDRFYW